ncbi:MAG: hypothetical protein AB1816_17165 [Bacillota bacterium]
MGAVVRAVVAAVRRWRAVRRLPPLLPVRWSRRGPEGGTLWVLEAPRVCVPLVLSEDSVLELADELRRDPGLRQLVLEVRLGPGLRQTAYLGPRLLPWVRCVVGAVAEEIRHARWRQGSVSG